MYPMRTRISIEDQWVKFHSPVLIQSEKHLIRKETDTQSNRLEVARQQGNQSVWNNRQTDKNWAYAVKSIRLRRKLYQFDWEVHCDQVLLDLISQDQFNYIDLRTDRSRATMDGNGYEFGSGGAVPDVYRK
jgi:hypothetical protein